MNKYICNFSTILSRNQKFIYDPFVITRTSFMIPVWAPIITHIILKNFAIFVFFIFNGYGINRAFNSPASLADSPKDPKVQYHLQSWALNKIVSPNR